METAELAVPGPERGRSRRWIAAAIGAAVVLVSITVAWTLRESSDDAPEVATVEPTLGAAGAATLEGSSARVRLRDDPDGDAVTVGVMSFGPDGRGAFSWTVEESDDDAPLAASEIRAFPDATYMRVDTQWIRYSNEDFTLDSGIRFGEGQNPVLGMVTTVLNALEHATPGTERRVGTALSHGDHVTVIEAEVDLAEAIRSTSEVVDELAADGFLGDLGTDATVWVDERGRVRLVRITGASEHIEVELWDFGVAVDVEMPADAIDDEALDPDDSRDQTTPELRELSDLQFCEAARSQAPIAIIEPDDDVDAWRAAAERMRTIADLAPTSATVQTARLADIYATIADGLDEGTLLSTMIESGLRTPEDTLPWQSLRSLEVQTFQLHEQLCP